MSWAVYGALSSYNDQCSMAARNNGVGCINRSEIIFMCRLDNGNDTSSQQLSKYYMIGVIISAENTAYTHQWTF